METRMEKRKRNRKEKRKAFYKLMVVLIILCMSVYGIKVVNQTIADLDYLENPNIFNLNIKEGKVDLFGKSYYIDLKILKEYE
ncbi:MAG: hypothetical protein GX320_04000 [Tissierellia bacterium]|nr:hypothetical protein [Tissierellia bacterium]